MDKRRYYNFTLIIYEDDEKFNNQYSELIKQKESIWIRHDQDVFENDIFENDELIHEAGEIKKPHYHFVLKLKNACTISALSKKFDISENMIEPIKRSFNGALKYLIHYGYDNKFQYDMNCVESNSEKLKRRFDDLIMEELPSVEKVITIYEFIDNFPDFIKISVLLKHARKINMFDAFSRHYNIIKDLVNEHNGEIAAERYHNTSNQRVNEDFYLLDEKDLPF